MVVKTVAKRGNVPGNWGRLYVVGKLRYLLSKMDTDDVCQEIITTILEYYSPSNNYHNMRLNKLNETHLADSPIIGVKAINRALVNKKFDLPDEVPIDPARLPSRV